MHGQCGRRAEGERCDDSALQSKKAEPFRASVLLEVDDKDATMRCARQLR